MVCTDTPACQNTAVPQPLACQSVGLPPERYEDPLMLGSSQLSCTLQALCTFQLQRGACRRKLIDGKCPIKHRVKLVTKHAHC